MPLVWGRFRYPHSSEKEFEDFTEEFWRRKRRNRNAPLQEGAEISLHDRCSFGFLKGDCYNMTVENQSRALLTEPEPGYENTKQPVQRPKLAELVSQPDGIRLTLLKSLQPPNRFTQVWAVRTVRGDRAIIKIFQSCMGNPPWLDTNNGEILDFQPEEEQSHREAWAYHQLRTLQGDCIPHSYGFYELLLPSGDKVCTHIMEEIPGSPLCRLPYSPNFNNHLNAFQLMTSTAEIVFRIHQLGVVHEDLGNQSNIMLMDSNGSQTPVVIDFGMALSPFEQTRDKESNSRTESPFKSDRIGLLGCFEDSMTTVATYHWFEQFVADRMHDPKWKSFLLDMDKREIKEWKPWSEEDWKMARDWDERLRKSWKQRHSKY